jgi:hypothetical protein
MQFLAMLRDLQKQIRNQKCYDTKGDAGSFRTAFLFLKGGNI